MMMLELVMKMRLMKMMIDSGDNDGYGIDEEDVATGFSDNDSGDQNDDDSDWDHCNVWDKSQHVNEFYH